MSDRAPLLRFNAAEMAALILANTNSLVLDFTARTAVGGTDLSYFIIKQLPTLAPNEFAGHSQAGLAYIDLIIPRVLELTYTADALQGFAHDLGYDGPPFSWDEARRHRLRCELDAIFAHMYSLDRSDVEWILDALHPSVSFPSLKQHELKKFGEYRTERYVLEAFDQLERGELPDLLE